MNKERRTSFARQSPFLAGQFRQKNATPDAEVRRSCQLAQVEAKMEGYLRELGL